MRHERLQRYSRHVDVDAAEQAYVALCSEFPHLSAFDDRVSEALVELDVGREARGPELRER